VNIEGRCASGGDGIAGWLFARPLYARLAPALHLIYTRFRRRRRGLLYAAANRIGLAGLAWLGDPPLVRGDSASCDDNISDD
jgi:hypothetical protein